VEPIVSSHGVAQTYLRISITDRCNLRCGYCMPPGGRPLVRHDDLLRYEEMLRLVRLLASAGVTKVRVTGGEPLIRRDIERLLCGIAATPGLKEICLTTNGTRLSGRTRAIRDAGVTRVNVSVDSLDPGRYAAITGGGALDEVLSGLAETAAAGFAVVKINTVLIKGINDDEAEAFARFSSARGFTQRFIELMPFRLPAAHGLPGDEVRRRLGAAGIDPAAVELISPVSRPFCSGCARLRVNAGGRLKSCLLSRHGLDLRGLMRRGADDAAITAAIRAFVQSGDKRLAEEINRWEERAGRLAMSEIGG
jgi:cyclic pyranopterin phosphate synthase